MYSCTVATYQHLFNKISIISLSWQTRKTKKTELDRLGNVIGSEIGSFNYFRNQIDGYYLDYDNKVSFTNVVSKPTLPDSKCYPIRSLIVAIITLSSLLIACIVIIFLNIKKQKID